MSIYEASLKNSHLFKYFNFEQKHIVIMVWYFIMLSWKFTGFFLEHLLKITLKTE